MAKKFRKVERFQAIDKQQVKGRVGHTRTGACTSKGTCYHGKTRRSHDRSR
jgi:hypothetical protein